LPPKTRARKPGSGIRALSIQRGRVRTSRACERVWRPTPRRNASFPFLKKPKMSWRDFALDVALRTALICFREIFPDSHMKGLRLCLFQHLPSGSSVRKKAHSTHVGQTCAYSMAVLRRIGPPKRTWTLEHQTRETMWPWL